ncbi:MAG: leucyl aminopeptidase family protein [Gammaproteobacteria bacterium]
MLIVETSAPAATGALPLWLVTDGALPGWLAEQSPEVANWVRANGFLAEKQRVLMLPGAFGNPAGAVVGLGALTSASELKLWHAAGLTDRLAPATYRLATPLSAAAATQFALGWLVGAYRFNRYRAPPTSGRAALVAPVGADITYAEAAASATSLARDLVNTPANDMGPAELAAAATDLARRFGGTIKITVGDELKAERFPLIHAVGAGSPRQPRLIDLRWGKPGGLRVTLVGKGVCFDTGGLDIKPSSGMLLMKKDMGGAACVLGVAQLLMQLDAPVQLRVLIPAVENSVDGHSYRPSDVIASRKGITVEIGNTDAEGRLVLADALAEADAEKPDLLIDLATLTGAARVALGPELPAAYATDAKLLAALHAIGDEEMDPIWPMPLWAGYDDEFSSKVADIGNVSAGGFAGSPIAALFLERFVTASPRWLHIDLYAWNPKERPGRPVGAEAQCVRSVYRLIRSRCA